MGTDDHNGRRRIPLVGAGNFTVFVTAAPVLVAVVMQVALLFAVAYLAVSSDSRLWTHHRDMISDRIAGLHGQIERQIVDTAVWDSLAEAVAEEPVDQQWLTDEVAGWFTTYFGFSTEAILAADGRFLWAGSRRGTEQQAFFDERCPGCLAIAEEVRKASADGGNSFVDFEVDIDLPIDRRPPLPEDYPVRVVTLDVDGVPTVAAATPIVHADPESRGSGPFPVLVVVQPFDATFMERMGRDLAIAGLALSTSADARGVPIMAEERRIATITWEEARPSRDALWTFLPALGAFMIVLTGLVTLLANWLRRASIDKLVGETLASHLAHHDPLTGIGNRSRLALDLDRALGQGGPAGAVTLLLLDLDGFKHVNDTLGHPAGDELLKEIATRVRATLPPGARVSRLGGDEFAVVLTGRDADRAEIYGTGIIAAAGEPVVVGTAVARVGCSIGMARAGGKVTDPSELLRKADVALYKAKADGRGCLRVFVPEMDGDVDPNPRDSRSVGAVTASLVVSLGNEAGSHALDFDVMPREHRGRLPLADIVRAAADMTAADPSSRLILPIGPNELTEDGAADRLLMLLDGADISPKRVSLRLVDGLRLVASPSALSALERLRSAGVGTILPDVGSSHLKLADLAQLPLDVVQLSPSLFRGLDEDSIAVVRLLVSLATLVGADVLADGVDTPEALAAAKSAGCRLVKGRMFESRKAPLPTLAIGIRSEAA